MWIYIYIYYVYHTSLEKQNVHFAFWNSPSCFVSRIPMNTCSLQPCLVHGTLDGYPSDVKLEGISKAFLVVKHRAIRVPNTGATLEYN